MPEVRATIRTKMCIRDRFGVGFYSAFMVASRVEVTTKKYGEETAYLWSSNAVDGYSIDECEKEEHGTEIVLYLKDNTEDENYDDYLQQYEIERLIKKYSDYIRSVSYTHLNGESDNSTIPTHIMNIRNKFSILGESPILTVWGIGYKWQ